MTQAITRIELDGMEPALADYLKPRVARLKYLGELFKCLAHAPKALLTFMQFTEALKEAVPDRLSEVAILSTATLMQNPYERHQHERLCVRTGLSRDWIAEVERLAPDRAVLMTPQEQAVQRYVVAAIETRGLGATAAFEAMAALLPQGEAVAIALLVGRYMTHALVVNTLQLAPPVPSIWDDGFGLSPDTSHPPAPSAKS